MYITTYTLMYYADFILSSLMLNLGLNWNHFVSVNFYFFIGNMVYSHHTFVLNITEIDL